mgnify:CR=1 FL=1
MAACVDTCFFSFVKDFITIIVYKISFRVYANDAGLGLAWPHTRYGARERGAIQFKGDAGGQTARSGARNRHCGKAAVLHALEIGARSVVETGTHLTYSDELRASLGKRRRGAAPLAPLYLFGVHAAGGRVVGKARIRKGGGGGGAIVVQRDRHCSVGQKILPLSGDGRL